MERRIESNPFREGTRAYRFLEIANMDYTTGYSRIVKRDELFQCGLGTTNGGDWCRNDGPLGKYFNIERKKEKGKIVSVQLIGHKKNVYNRKIFPEIYKIKDLRCCVIDVHHSIEIDHKDGRYDDYKINLDMKDFQPLHTSVNKAKRQHCKTCKETGIRYDATRLGYSVSQYIGPEKYMGSCIGCYWYDPSEFNKQVSKHYKKVK